MCRIIAVHVVCVPLRANRLMARTDQLSSTRHVAARCVNNSAHHGFPAARWSYHRRVIFFATGGSNAADNLVFLALVRNNRLKWENRQDNFTSPAEMVNYLVV